MTIKGFIEKAIEGGWNGEDLSGELCVESDGSYGNLPSVLLNPEAWKAVGKVEGWNKAYAITQEESTADGDSYVNQYRGVSQAEYNMLEMVHALAEGKTLEQFINTL